MKNNRSRPPEVKTLLPRKVPLPELSHLGNGTVVHEIQNPHQQAMKIQWIYPAGRTAEHHNAVASATARLLKAGTDHHCAQEISRLLDDQSCNFSCRSGADVTVCTLLCLHKSLPTILPIISEILQRSTFPEKELTLHKSRATQNLNEALAQGDMVSYRELTRLLFGESHPYGYNTTSQDIDALRRKDVITHYKQNIRQTQPLILVAGGKGSVAMLEEHFGSTPSRALAIPECSIDRPQIGEPVSLFVPDVDQVSLKLGRLWPGPMDPDAVGLSVLNTVLGGYFGSRLVRSLREDKGLTYNTYSTENTLRFADFQYLSVECNRSKTHVALDGIRSILEGLSAKSISDKELKRVRSYIIGALYNAQDGVFAVMNIHKKGHILGLPQDYTESYQKKLFDITPSDLQKLAQKYLQYDDYQVVLAGNVKN